jgi:hypothetical protein
MRGGPRAGLPLSVGTLLVHLVTAAWGGGTWPRDDAGVAAPPCIYTKADGNFVACGDANPLPTASGTTLESTPTSTSRGYGKVWQEASGIAETGLGAIPVAVGSNDIVVFRRSSTTTLEVYTTRNLGVTWSLYATVPNFFSNNTEDTMKGALYIPSEGVVVIARSFLPNGVAQCRLFESRDLVTWTARHPSLCAQGNSALDLNGWLTPPMLQGNTMVIVGTNAQTPAQTIVFRSTDRGKTWTEITGTAMPAQVRRVAGQRLASPSAGIWITTVVRDGDSRALLYRSADDGLTWSQVLDTGVTVPSSGGAVPVVACLTATRCLASTPAPSGSIGQIWASDDAGVTWTSVGGIGTCCYGFVNFGNGAVAGLGLFEGTPPSNNGWIHSTDYGATWQVSTAVDLATPGSSTTPPICNVAVGLATGVAMAGRCDLILGGTGTATVFLTRPTYANEPVGSQGTAYRQEADGALDAVMRGQQDDTATAACSEDAYCNVRITSARAAHVNLRDASGNEVATSTAAPSGSERGLIVRPIPSGTQTVSGTVTATQGTAGTSPWAMALSQRGTRVNSSSTGAANTAVTVTITAASGESAHLYAIDAYCSAGASSLTVQDGATTIWRTPATEVGTTLFSRTWPVPLTGTPNTAMTITLGTCGVGNTGTLSVQADRW